MIPIAAKQFAIKGTKAVFEKKRNKARINVYRIDEDAEANSLGLIPQFPLSKLSAIVKWIKVSSKGYMKMP